MRIKLPLVKSQSPGSVDLTNAQIEESLSDVVRVGLAYVCVQSPSEPEVPRDFMASHKLFASSYCEFRPSIIHDCVIINYSGERTVETDNLFSMLYPKHTYSVCGGFDIGALCEVGKTMDYDFILFCNSNVRFHKSGWLERMVQAFQKHGDGIYGPMGSFERSPHLRTCCIGIAPSLLRKYPYHIKSRADACRAESGDWNITQWVRSQNKPALMVTWDQELEVNDWREPGNIFRRGDQSNCLVWDRHTKVYSEAIPEYKKELEQSVQGIHGVHTFDILCKPSKTITIVAMTSLAPNSHALAIQKTAECVPFKCERLLMSPVNVPSFDGRQLRLPKPWAKNGRWTIEEMADFTLTGLHKYIQTDLVIIVHWDGYAINPDKWTNEFLEYDFIGAPWPSRFPFLKNGARVGNGGFSLRSRRWLEAAATLPKLPHGTSEDVYTSVHEMNHFTKLGLKIAPVEVAIRWSLEWPVEDYPWWKLSDSLGFHGLTDQDPSRAHLRLDPNT